MDRPVNERSPQIMGQGDSDRPVGWSLLSTCVEVNIRMEDAMPNTVTSARTCNLFGDVVRWTETWTVYFFAASGRRTFLGEYQTHAEAEARLFSHSAMSMGESGEYHRIVLGGHWAAV